MKFILTLFICSIAFTEIAEEEQVLILDDSNFDEALKQHDNLMVEFYAPWCGHCKKLASEYVAAAKELRQMSPPLYLAKVDATANPKLSKEFAIRGFPTLKFFKDGKSREYDMGRTKEDIVNYVKSKSGPVTVTYNTAADLKKSFETHFITVVGYFETKDCNEYRDWYDIMATVDDIAAVTVTDSSMATEMNAKVPSVVMYKGIMMAIPFNGEIKDLKRWILLHELPPIIPFSQQMSKKLFAPELGIKQQLMYFASDTKPGESLRVMNEIATSYFGKLFVVHIPSNNKRLLEYFGVVEEKTPALILADFGGEAMKKYLFKGQITGEAVREFIDQFFGEELVPYYKSEELPTLQKGVVYKLVGKDFDQIVYDTKKNVLVKFYAPWCGHRKALAPIYEQLAEYYAQDNEILIAEIDATANEVKDINIRGFPTIKFFKAGDTQHTPIDFEGDRTFDALKDFVEKNRGAVKEMKTDDEL